MIARITISRIFTFAILAGAGLVSSQSISSKCESALAGVAASPDAACLNPSALVSLVLAGDSSIVTPINNWLQGLCATGPCSNNSLSEIVTNVTAGCGNELSALGLPSTSAELIPTVEEVYPAVHQIACLKDTSAQQLCVTETLTNIQSIEGTVTLDDFTTIISNLATSNSFPSNITCTNCIKQAYNIINQDFPSQSSDFASALQSQCGSGFVDGSSASGISEIASTSTATSPSASNAALGTSSLVSRSTLAGLAVSALITVSTGFAFLA